ncbi:MAG: response regulator [Vicinamibacteria bacterium]|nr:response regulator [Vicinamibacteria bacterium]
MSTPPPPRILIVDDDALFRRLLERHYTEAGWEVVSKSGITDGLAAYAKAPFDLVLVDYLLKDGNGHDFVQGVRETDLDVPILVVSGAFDIEALTGFVREAIDDVLPKPIDFDKLKDVTLRLSRLGRERRRMRRRALALLEVSRNLKVGGDSKELLSRFVRAVSEITPFRRAAIYVTDVDSRLAFRSAVHGAGALPDRVPSLELSKAFERGFRLGLACFVPGSVVALNRPTPREPYLEARARKNPPEPGDYGLVEIRSPHRLWGYILFEDPDDGQRPSEDSMHLLSLLSGYVATVLENRDSFDAEARLRSRLEMVRDVVHLALQRADLGGARSVMTTAAVTRAGYAYSAFLERHGEGLWSIEAPCPSLQGAKAPALMRDVLELQTKSAKPSEALHLPRQSFILGHAPRFSCAIPVFSGPDFRGYFVIEDDVREVIEAADEAAFLTLCDQMGLLIRRLDYERELARKNAEIQSSYAQLEAIHLENVRMQEVLRRYVPPSTWDKIDKVGPGGPEGIEEVVDRAVMFVDVCGFTHMSEMLKPAQIVAMLNAYFTVVASICYQHGGEIVKYIGDGIMGFFPDGLNAIAAVSDILDARGKISAELKKHEIDPIEIRVGVAWGPTIVTSVGPFYQQDRTLLGDTVNTASRLEHRAMPGSALFDSGLIGNRDPASLGLKSVGLLNLRGKRKPVTVLTLEGDVSRYATEKTGEIALGRRSTNHAKVDGLLAPDGLPNLG